MLASKPGFVHRKLTTSFFLFTVIEARSATNIESGNPDLESLPSYTIVSGLPSYAEALEQLKKVKEQTKGTGGVKTNEAAVWTPHTPPAPMQPLSVRDLFQKIIPSEPTTDKA